MMTLSKPKTGHRRCMSSLANDPFAEVFASALKFTDIQFPMLNHRSSFVVPGEQWTI